VVASALSLAPGRARGEQAAQRRTHILDADGPPSLPGLSHRGVAFDFEYTVAVSEATDVLTSQPIESSPAYAYSARWLVEAPLSGRSWYLGATHVIGAASVPTGDSPSSGGSSMVLGNPEAWVRGLWSSTSGLAAGGGLSVVVPVPRSFSSSQSEVVRAIRVVRPQSYPHFQDLALTARPFFDVRHLTGPLILQLRQGVDVSVLLREPGVHENRYDLTVQAAAYAGLSTFEGLTLGVELAEAYQLTADVSSATCLAPCDEHRVQVTLSPSVRIRLPRLSPSLSVLLPLSTPLRAEVSDYYAARLHLDTTF